MDKVVHFEIPADDMKRAKDFYSRSFGWKLNEVPEMGGYVTAGTAPSNERGMSTEAGAINGGMMKRDGPVKGPVITIAVENIDDAIKRLEKNGGKVVIKKMKVGDMGFSAYFRDTEGNVIGLWQAARR